MDLEDKWPSFLSNEESITWVGRNVLVTKTSALYPSDIHTHSHSQRYTDLRYVRSSKNEHTQTHYFRFLNKSHTHQFIKSISLSLSFFLSFFSLSFFQYSHLTTIPGSNSIKVSIFSTFHEVTQQKYVVLFL